MPNVTPEQIREDLQGLTEDEQMQYLDELDKRQASTPAADGEFFPEIGLAKGFLKSIPRAALGAGQALLGPPMQEPPGGFNAVGRAGVRLADLLARGREALAPSTELEAAGMKGGQFVQQMLGGLAAPQAIIPQALTAGGITAAQEGKIGLPAVLSGATAGLSTALMNAAPAMREHAARLLARIGPRRGPAAEAEVVRRIMPAVEAGDTPVALTPRGLYERAAGQAEQAGKTVRDVYSAVPEVPAAGAIDDLLSQAAAAESKGQPELSRALLVEARRLEGLATTTPGAPLRPFSGEEALGIRIGQSERANLFKPGQTLTPARTEAIEATQQALSREMKKAAGPVGVAADAMDSARIELRGIFDKAGMGTDHMDWLKTFILPRLVVSGVAGGAGYAAGGPKGALAGVGGAILLGTPFWKSLSARQWAQLAKMAEAGNEAGATQLLRAAAADFAGRAGGAGEDEQTIRDRAQARSLLSGAR